MKVVTAGLAFLDIDAYAGCVAYTELMNQQGIEAVAFSSATFNESITSTVLSWGVPFSTNYEPKPTDTFVLIDVSEPEFIEKYADLAKVEEVIDHHPGFEDYWQERIGDKADIEFIGAVCTRVYEKWTEADLEHTISRVSARLLICGILDNTLNLKAKITTDRDRLAIMDLYKIADLPSDWADEYFSECEAAILQNVEKAIRNDTKLLTFKNLDIDKIAIGQLVVWDAQKLLGAKASIISKTLGSISDNWLMNVVSLSEGKSYFVTSKLEIKEWLERILSIGFTGDVAAADRLWLRKEITKQDVLYDQ